MVAGGPLPAASTPWISVPGEMRARCSSAGGASVLQVSPVAGARTFTPVPDPSWGLHLVDGNIALGTLTKVVARQAREYLRTTAR